MYDDRWFDHEYDDFINAKTADEYIAAEENHCIFNMVRRDNARIRNQKFDFDAYITSEINRYFDGCKNVDATILGMIKKMRDKVDLQHSMFLVKLNLYNSIMDDTCPVKCAFEYAYNELSYKVTTPDNSDLDNIDFSDESTWSLSDFIPPEPISKSEFKKIYFDTGKYKKLLRLPHEDKGNYHYVLNQLEQEIRSYMYDRNHFNIYNNMTPSIIRLFYRECNHPGTVVFVNGRYKKIRKSEQFNKILRQRLPINIRTSEEFKTTADKHKHHNRFDMDIDLIKEEA